MNSRTRPWLRLLACTIVGAALVPLCIYMHVGERDPDWIETMTWQAQQLNEAGASVSLRIEPGQDHVMQSLTGSGAQRLFAHFDDAEAGCES